MKTIKPIAILAILFSVLLGACETDIPEKTSYTEATVEKTDILSVTNMSTTDVSLSFSKTPAPASLIPAIASNYIHNRNRSGPGKVYVKDLPAAMRFNANPPKITRTYGRAGFPDMEPIAAPVNNVGDKKTFQIDVYKGDKPNTYEFQPCIATLRVQGVYCNIWVADDDYLPASTKYSDLADKFDLIYPVETNLIGYEYGGDDGSGGMDGDMRIQILIYDLNEGANIEEDGITLGYFWSKDEYTQAELNAMKLSNIKTNEAEIFYIDASTMEYENAETGAKGIDIIYSTLIHEFQHMINFNQKAIKRHLNSETWYNEMLSMLTEDVIGPLVGIEPKDEGGTGGHPIDERIREYGLFLDFYNLYGVDEWYDVSSYHMVYAFGAYLIRNYGGEGVNNGGPGLIKKMLSNNLVNQASVNQALQTVNYAYSFEDALENYGEALIYSTASPKGFPAGKLSFEKESSSTINGRTYKAYAFDIWTMDGDPEYRNYIESVLSIPLDSLNKKGPVIYPYVGGTSSYAHTVWLHQGILNETLPENFTIGCTYPSRADIRLKVYK